MFAIGIKRRSATTYEGAVRVCAHYVVFWFRGSKPISDELKERLNDEAESRAKHCINDGYVQGELHYTTADEHEDQYSGWWRIERD